MEPSTNSHDIAIPIALKGGGEMGEQIRKLDWSRTSLGRIDKWPKTLQSSLSICINSNFPIAIYWGVDLILLYNDPWSPIPGNKHPWALGRPASDVWPDIWSDIEPQFQKAFQGIPGGSKDALLPMQRHGYTEECYFDFTFTPIYGETGNVEGVFNAVIETTYRFINERRSFALQRLSNAINSISQTSEAIEIAGKALEEIKIDIPFYLIYNLTGENQFQIQQLSHGLDKRTIDLGVPVDEFLHTDEARLLTNLNPRLLSDRNLYWPETPVEAYAIPFARNDSKVFGWIILGISPRRRFDNDYKSFCESIASIINGELNTISALEEERRRSEMLAELDRAKTTFFSNISHEFRTPLTLMLSPLEFILENSENLTVEQKSNIEASYRNTLRLQKLVNSLLDFSRIQAGRMEPNFEEVDIGNFTEDLASSFRSTIESTGLIFNVRIERVEGPVFVDVDMWENIVLNLISNAFKYTRKGKVEVEIKPTDAGLFEFSVSDTGVGISVADQSRIFDRFYRVVNSEGRSQEGTGIGLAMVKELVHLHRGTIRVESIEGEGSKFVVQIPLGRPQNIQKILPVKKLQGERKPRRDAYAEQANTWSGENSPSFPDDSFPDRVHSLNPKVLIADDNSDMRKYLHRLLLQDFQVRSVSNGEDAFVLALEWKPDLIISDIMMPKLDGFGLLKKLKNNLSTRNTPIIFLSARAGQEATVEGIESGVDDYLSKPFSAKELLARVRNLITISSTRRKTEKEFYNLFLQSPAHIHVMKGPEHVFEFFHPLGIPFAGRDVTGLKVRDALPQVEGQGFFELLDSVYKNGEPINLREAKAVLPNGDGDPIEYYFNITYLPWRDLHGNIQGVLQFTFEVTETVKQRLKAEASERNLRSIAEQAPVAICVLKGPDHVIQIVNERVLEMWGRTYESVIDLPVYKALPEVVGQGYIELLDNVYNTATPYSANELPLEIVRNGILQKIYLNFIYQPFLNPEQKVDGVIVVAIDVTEQVTSRKVLEEAEYNLKNAIELAELGTWDVDLLTQHLDYSPRFAEWWGLSDKGASLSKILECIHPEDRDNVSGEIDRAIKERGYYEAEYRLVNCSTKQERHIQANGKVFYDHLDRPVRMIGIVADVTLFKMTQYELERQVNVRTAELVELNKDLSSSNDNLRQFAYVASHDLQEPLRKIQTFSEMAKDHVSDESYLKKYLSKIDSSAARMSALIKDVLVFSQVSREEKVQGMVDLNVVLEEVTTDFELLIEQKNARIQATSLPIVSGNKFHFRQLFHNLIGNSLKFCETPPLIEIGGTVTDGEEIPASLKHVGRYHRLEFKDNGIGFEPEYAEQIFGLFARLHNRKDFGGTGIGLALCKKIVESYNGFIFAKSKKGEGATFIILLPLETL